MMMKLLILKTTRATMKHTKGLQNLFALFAIIEDHSMKETEKKRVLIC